MGSCVVCAHPNIFFYLVLPFPLRTASKEDAPSLTPHSYCCFPAFSVAFSGLRILRTPFGEPVYELLHRYAGYGRYPFQLVVKLFFQPDLYADLAIRSG
ncbi:hypothetical protein Pla108_11730 [Botrimarina colliarenosi]|uniref:Uncharacterized protein n=1 Tax=Botrimarina colliarenosi TaxID=2528001 RepID=A0A5C6AM75_9BACT|nr:hypothetical protein Pla108_11730 [Botrimarina colliarenosi]